MKPSIYVVLVVSIFGCAEPDTPDLPPTAMLEAVGQSQPVSSGNSMPLSAEVKPGEEVFFFDSESLQQGVGPVDDDHPEEFTTTDSGLKYRILRKSDARHPAATESVLADYRGWLDNGSEFDSSYSNGKPISFGLDRVIAGWTEGLQLVGNGGMIELWIPSDLGYGSKGSPGAIPPNATLHFVVELKGIGVEK